MGMSMDFTVEVIKWMKGKEKTWETIGETKLIISSWYRMHLLVTPKGSNTNAELSISYEKLFGFFDRILYFFLPIGIVAGV